VKSEHEILFAVNLDRVGCPMVQEHKFRPDRNWRLDFADPETRVAVEIDGGEFMRGAHNRGVRMARDYEKRNTAATMGWTIFQLTGKMVQHEGNRWARIVASMIVARRARIQ